MFILHLIILPLIPILVILAQNASIYGGQVMTSQEVVAVKLQVQTFCLHVCLCLAQKMENKVIYMVVGLCMQSAHLVKAKL